MHHRCSLQCGGCLVTVFIVTMPVSIADTEGPGYGGIRPSLSEIMVAGGSDKWWRHGYDRFYERELGPFRDLKGARILEMGVMGGESLRVWLDYFTAPAAVHGLDNFEYGTGGGNPHRSIEYTRAQVCRSRKDRCHLVHIWNMSQSNSTDLRRLARIREGWDIIIDDASHKPRDQLRSFVFLFPRLRPGGIYVVEDLQNSYGFPYDQGKPLAKSLQCGKEQSCCPGVPNGIGTPGDENSAVQTFKDLIDVVNRRVAGQPVYTVLGPDIDEHIVRVSFVEGMVVLEKRPSGGRWNMLYPNPDFYKTLPACFATGHVDRIREYRRKLREIENDEYSR